MLERLHELAAHEINSLIRARKISAREAAQSFIARIEALDPKLRAYITVTADTALRQADLVDAALARGEEIGPLAGVPGAIKDNISTRGVLTTCASRILRNYTPVYNATVINRLESAGFVLLGKTNLDEFAMGSSTENSALFVTRNPWDTDRVPGGSSGGSTAAVAAGECAFALGSDTGGSIRQPASFCGVVGLRPTYGRVSRYGVTAFASSVDQVGPVTRDVTDCALVLNAISGKDPMDSTSLDVETPDFTASLVDDVRGLRIGVPAEFFGQGTDPAVEKAVREAIDLLCSLGAVQAETSMPMVDYALPAYHVIAPVEACSNLARYDGVRYGLRSERSPDVDSMFSNTRDEGFGPEVKQRIMVGAYALMFDSRKNYYQKAQKVRTLLRREFDKAFEEFDVIITPTSPTVAFGVGELAEDPFAMKRADICAIPAGLAGLPAISVPCGFSGGLPIGLQIIARGLDEAALIRTAFTFERNTEHHKARPNLQPEFEG